MREIHHAPYNSHHTTLSQPGLGFGGWGSRRTTDALSPLSFKLHCPGLGKLAASSSSVVYWRLLVKDILQRRLRRGRRVFRGVFRASPICSCEPRWVCWLGWIRAINFNSSDLCTCGGRVVAILQCDTAVECAVLASLIRRDSCANFVSVSLFRSSIEVRAWLVCISVNGDQAVRFGASSRAWSML